MVGVEDPGLDAVGDDVGDGGVEVLVERRRPPSPARAGGCRAGPAPARAATRAAQLLVAGQASVEERATAFGGLGRRRRAWPLVEHAGDLVRVGQHVGEEVFLGVEVVVQQAGRDPGGLAMPAIRTWARPSRTMQSAAAARILLRASAAARSRWLGSLGDGSARALLRRSGPRPSLTVQSVSDARLAAGEASRVRLGRAVSRRRPRPARRPVRPRLDRHRRRQRRLRQVGAHPQPTGARVAGRPAGAAGQPARRRGARAAVRTHARRRPATTSGNRSTWWWCACPPAALVADGGGRGGSRGSVARRDHGRALRAGRRRSPGGGRRRCALARVGGRGAGRAELPRGRRHQRRSCS